jgi:hypothetical protein
MAGARDLQIRIALFMTEQIFQTNSRMRWNTFKWASRDKLFWVYLRFFMGDLAMSLLAFNFQKEKWSKFGGAYTYSLFFVYSSFLKSRRFRSEHSIPLRSLAKAYKNGFLQRTHQSPPDTI